MPELPDVEQFRRYLDDTSLSQPVSDVEAGDAGVLEGISLDQLRRAVRGRSFATTSRHGKFLFVQLESPPVLILHFGMTGYLDYARDDRPPPAHARVVFHLTSGYRLAYVCPRKLGLVTRTDDPQSFIEQRGLGPDALAGCLTRRRFRDRLSSRRGAIKSALMNQSVVAGIGNIYADEILFQARIAPGRKVDELGDEAVHALFRAMRRVLQTAVRNRAEVARLPRTYLLRHRDADGLCPRCRKRLQWTRTSGRGTCFCSTCQQ